MKKNIIPFFKWKFRFSDMKIITANRNVKLLDSIEEYIRKTKKDNHKTNLTLQCNICLDIVTTTNINKFIFGNLGCSCNKNTPYYKRYFECLEICKDRNITLLDTEAEYIKKTIKDGYLAFLRLLCLDCNTIVTSTNIQSFINDSLGCSCNKNIPYYEKYPEFLIICKNRNLELLDSEEEYIEKTKKYGAYSLLKLKCLICLQIVDTTDINSFVNNCSLGCSCSNKIPWYRRYPEFLIICKKRNTILLDS